MNVEVDLRDSPDTIGYFAFDDVELTFSEVCETLPDAALPNPLPVCDFEIDDCGWTADPDPEVEGKYGFRRLNGAEVGVGGHQGPPHDPFGNVEGFFMNVDANGTQTHGEIAKLYSSFFNGTEYPKECLHFYYALEV